MMLCNKVVNLYPNAHSLDDDGAFRLPSHCQRITISTTSSGTASRSNAPLPAELC